MATENSAALTTVPLTPDGRPTQPSSGSQAARAAVTYCPTRGCHLCGCRKFELLSVRDRHGDPLRTVACWRCGLVAQETIAAPDELEQFYREEYREEYNGERSPSPRRVVREWHRARERFALLKSYLRPDDAVFEVGAGIGCNLKQFELAGHAAEGIEPGRGFAEFSRRELCCDVRVATLEQVTSSSRWDLVLLVHVLEHLPFPKSALGQIRDFLRPGGRLYVEVPNLAAPHSGPGQLFHRAHLYDFTPWTLAALANASGFEVLAQLSDPGNRNLQMVLQRRDSFEYSVDASSFARTREILDRHTSLTYYGRWSYLRRRGGELLRAAARRLTIRREYAAILQQCREQLRLARRSAA
jgi:SAM-dependent methyltransferase